MAAHSVSVAQEIKPNRTGKEVNIFASNWWARTASYNKTALAIFVCTVFEHGDEMLTLLSMKKKKNKKTMGECNLKGR